MSPSARSSGSYPAAAIVETTHPRSTKIPILQPRVPLVSRSVPTPLACSPFAGVAGQPRDIEVAGRPVLVASSLAGLSRKPVLIVLAGYNQSRSALDAQARLSARAASAELVVAILQGDGATPSWRLNSDNRVDIDFVTATLDRLLARCGDPQRVVLVGFSDGGLMAARVGCTLGRRVRVLVMVSSSIGPGPGCVQPPGVLAVHGTTDPYDPYDGNGREIPPAREAIAAWTHQAGCGSGAEHAASRDVMVLSYPSCAVSLVTLTGGGHTWPGGAPSPDGHAGAVAQGYDLTSTLLAISQ